MTYSAKNENGTAKGDKPVFSENRSLASRVLAVCAIFAIVVMGPVKLSGKRNGALNVFRGGSYENMTLSVYTDLKSAAENGNKLANTCASSLGETDAGVADLKSLAATILDNQDDEQTMLTAFYRLVLVADEVYARFLALNPNEDAAREARAQYANITSASNTIEKDGYFALADSFNHDLNGFPARLLGGLFGIDELGT